MKAAISLFLLLLTFALQARVCDLNSPLKTYKPKYAKHFSIDYFQHFKVIRVDQEIYLLANKLDCTYSSTLIRTPVKKVAMMSTTYLPALELLSQEKTLIAFQGKRFIVSNAFDLNSVREISYKFNPEDLLTLKADLIMGYDSNLSGIHQKKIFKSLKLPVVINKDYEEKSPLARAEWIVFTSSFFDQEEKALEIFNKIEADYLQLKNENLKMPKTSTIVGSIENGLWVTCGGESDLAQMIADAGGVLAFSKPSPNTQKISLEEIAQKKVSYDVWLTHNMWESKEERMAAMNRDPRYKFVRAVNVYNNNLVMNKSKASDYWETALQRPDLLLQDLTLILHPETLKKHELHWYRKL